MNIQEIQGNSFSCPLLVRSEVTRSAAELVGTMRKSDSQGNAGSAAADAVTKVGSSLMHNWSLLGDGLLVSTP
jgi:hypothetical protein